MTVAEPQTNAATFTVTLDVPESALTPAQIHLDTKPRDTIEAAWLGQYIAAVVTKTPDGSDMASHNGMLALIALTDDPEAHRIVLLSPDGTEFEFIAGGSQNQLVSVLAPRSAAWIARNGNRSPRVRKERQPRESKPRQPKRGRVLGSSVALNDATMSALYETFDALNMPELPGESLAYHEGDVVPVDAEVDPFAVSDDDSDMTAEAALDNLLAESEEEETYEIEPDVFASEPEQQFADEQIVEVKPAPRKRNKSSKK